MNKAFDAQVAYGKWLMSINPVLQYIIVVFTCFGMPALYLTIVIWAVPEEPLRLLWAIPLAIVDFGLIRFPTFTVMEEL